MFFLLLSLVRLATAGQKIKDGSSIVAGSPHVVSWRSAAGSSHGVNSPEGGILVAGCSHVVSWCSSGVSTT